RRRRRSRRGSSTCSRASREACRSRSWQPSCSSPRAPSRHTPSACTRSLRWPTGRRPSPQRCGCGCWSSLTPSPAPQVVRPAVADRTPALRLADLRDDGRLYRILLEHAFLGIRVQLLLRLALAAFVVAVVLAVPPEHKRVACDVV